MFQVRFVHPFDTPNVNMKQDQTTGVDSPPSEAPGPSRGFQVPGVHENHKPPVILGPNKLCAPKPPGRQTDRDRQTGPVFHGNQVLRPKARLHLRRTLGVRRPGEAAGANWVGRAVGLGRPKRAGLIYPWGQDVAGPNPGMSSR